MWKLVCLVLSVAITLSSNVITLRTLDDKAPSIPDDTLPESIEYEETELGFSALPEGPQDNPITEAKIQLGRKLFFDPILSRDGTVACASCHRPESAFADNEKVAKGINGRKGTRNVPSILNRGYGQIFSWDGKDASLEAQVLGPLTNENELGNPDIDSVSKTFEGECRIC